MKKTVSLGKMNFGALLHAPSEPPTNVASRTRKHTSKKKSYP